MRRGSVILIMKEDLNKKAEEYLNGWKRAQADLVNYKKDEVKRFGEMAKFANETLIKGLLPVLDSFDRAIANGHSEQSEESGLPLVRSQFYNILNKNGLERLPDPTGKEFDPKFQEAIAVEKSEKKSGIVAEEVEAGYQLNNKLIRPTKVKVYE